MARDTAINWCASSCSHPRIRLVARRSSWRNCAGCRRRSCRRRARASTGSSGSRVAMTDSETRPDPTLDEIRLMRHRLGEHVLTTPLRRWDDAAIAYAVEAGTAVFLKEELFQRTGSFKPRG